jgi:hypothetical protein
MSIDNTPAVAEGSMSAVKVGKVPKMVDGREETKEERKARKAAKRAVCPLAMALGREYRLMI